MKFLIKTIPFIAIALIIGYQSHALFTPKTLSFEEMPLAQQREQFLAERNHMQHNMLEDEHYACCLKTPCTYCIEKDPKHGAGATCRCLDDVVNGLHPCGECIGEILEGHGNKYLAKYFARSIAEEVGEDHLDTLRQIISEKYDISLEDQS